MKLIYLNTFTALHLFYKNAYNNNVCALCGVHTWVNTLFVDTAKLTTYNLPTVL
jgi:hypothetical protein